MATRQSARRALDAVNAAAAAAEVAALQAAGVAAEAAEKASLRWVWQTLLARHPTQFEPSLLE
jgi:hypothetical protein